MAAKVFNLEFDGYWREVNKSGVPSESGIYCVYTCTYNTTAKTVDLKKLVYIGESDDVKKRITNHEKLEEWKTYLNSGEVLCYSVAKVASADRNRCEAAMIYKHKPPVNTEYVNNFPFADSTINLTGTTKFLTTHFTVSKS